MRPSMPSAPVPTSPARLRRAILVLAAAAVLISVHDIQTSDSADDIAVYRGPGSEIVEAQNHYVQGRFLFNRRLPGDLVASQEHFLQAIELDSGYADAWAGLSGAFNIQWYLDGSEDDEKL